MDRELFSPFPTYRQKNGKSKNVGTILDVCKYCKEDISVPKMKIHEKICQKKFGSSRKVANLQITKGSKYSAYFDIFKNKATCKKCGTVISSQKGCTSGMKYHAEKKHNIDFGDEKNQSEEQITKNPNLTAPPTLDGFTDQNRLIGEKVTPMEDKGAGKKLLNLSKSSLSCATLPCGYQGEKKIRAPIIYFFDGRFQSKY